MKIDQLPGKGEHFGCLLAPRQGGGKVSLPAGLGAPFNALDGRPFTSILYGNGPGYKLEKGTRPDVTDKESRKFCEATTLEVEISGEWGQRPALNTLFP